MNSMIHYPHINVNEGMRTMSEQIQIEWIDTHEAAQIMNVELSTVSTLCRRGKLNCRQHGTGHRSVWEVDKQSALAYKKSVGGRPRKKKLWAKLQEIAAEENPQPPRPTKTTRFQNTGSKGIASGHGRKKRTHSRTNPPKSRFKANKVSTIMMERNDKKQAAIRAKYAAEHSVRYPNLMSINPRYWKIVMDTVNDMPMRKKAA